MHSKMLLVFFAAAIFTCAAPAPRFRSLSMVVNVNEATIVFGPPDAAPVVTGAPYSADEEQEYRQTLSDGTSNTRRSVIGHFARDSQGRMRLEEAWKAAPIWITEIFDPVQGFAYVLDGQKRIAHRMAIRPSDLRPAATQSTAQQSTTEDLGTQTIEGVFVTGTRTITTLAASPGRNGPSALTYEAWDSPELGLTVLSRSSNGYTDRLIHLSRAEPDAARFRPPAEYTIVDEKESFTTAIKFR
ncbi:MAG TPA: hypothetical protein VJN43_14810 [Bryobacteraceae bacterium]|nr:hypothetical protein [Bryobacteraceae bacterium]